MISHNISPPFIPPFISPLGGIGSALGLLDTYGGALAAYSLRNLSAAWVGSDVILARRSSDNAELGFTATDITDGTLAAWASAGDAFVKTWYDQSGNAYNIEQTVAGSQPTIVSSGTLLTDDKGKPTVSFSSDYLIGALFGATVTQPFTIFLYGSKTGGGAGQVNVGGLSGNQSIFYNGLVNNLAAIAGSSSVINETDIKYAIANGASSAIGINGNALTTGIMVNTLERVVIGATASGASPLTGNVGEVIVYPNNATTNRAAIESDMADKYGVTLA